MREDVAAITVAIANETRERFLRHLVIGPVLKCAGFQTGCVVNIPISAAKEKVAQPELLLERFPVGNAALLSPRVAKGVINHVLALARVHPGSWTSHGLANYPNAIAIAGDKHIYGFGSAQWPQGDVDLLTLFVGVVAMRYAMYGQPDAYLDFVLRMGAPHFEENRYKEFVRELVE